MRGRKNRRALETLTYSLEFTFRTGLDGYLFSMIFILATVGLAKIILKTCTRQNFKYSNLLVFCIIGLILSLILKIFKFNLSKEYLETFGCLFINIIIFIIFKYIKKRNIIEEKNKFDKLNLSENNKYRK